MSLRHKNRSEVGVLCVNESLIQYVFRVETKPIRYSVDMRTENWTCAPKSEQGLSHEIFSYSLVKHFLAVLLWFLE